MNYHIFNYIDCEFFYLKNILNLISLNDDYNIIAGIIHTEKEAKKVLDKIDKNKKNILIQVSEETDTPYHSEIYNLFYKVFRTYNNNSKIDNTKVFPIPSGHITRFLSKSIFEEIKLPAIKDIKNREYDIFFVGHGNQERCLCSENIKNLKNFKTLTNLTNQFGGGYSLQDYYELLNNTKISAVPMGFSIKESFRFFESFTLGCIVVTTFPFNSNEYSNIWYYQNCPAIYIPSWNNLNSELIENILNHKEEIFYQNKNYYDNFLSPKAVAKYIQNKSLDIS